ncbi:nitrile hydratase subunit beta [Pseudooceanicola sp.]|uniref:nitrile hydratase subunit beta n=1 Tax=Pseudooceanicola sp. TaxID=1914328 RepID=UPI00261CBAAA|nr:nitrile hydratase subunit beta [Pseudooceanicola sp.]MDF1857164.1 nitrile hydratase subunit beta [Pseudooceanicola sp.]
MNGPQDIGGRHGFGPVAPALNASAYHPGANWEPRAMAITVAAGAGGHWTIDESRFMRENRDPAEYYRLSYFQLWLTALAELLTAKGLVTEAELAAGHAGTAPTTPPGTCLSASAVPGVLARGGPVDRDPGAARPGFAPGDLVRTRNHQPAGHTRLPGYARDKVGRIESVQGFHAFADASAEGDRQAADWLYTVVFEAETLFGAAEATGDSVSVDAWEPYLVRA